MERADRSPRRPWKDRYVVLGVTGGIAAYKSVQVARDLTLLGARVDVVLSRGARHFVRPLTFEAVTGRPAHTELFDTSGDGRGGAALHLSLGAEADVVCVAPATADFIARASQGRADDLLTTTLLATRAPVVLAPAMNDRMFAHPQVQANLSHCRDVLGYTTAGPGRGPLAYGEGEGPGRMIEPDEIVQYLGRELQRGGVLDGRSVLVTAGPTREPIDPVRYVGNRSSGKTGFALAQAAWRRGCHVTLISGPSSLPPPVGVPTYRVETALEMEDAVRDHLPASDVVIFAAAVADFRPREGGEVKLKRSEVDDPTIALTANPDIASETRPLRKAGALIVGFALETEDLLANARAKMDAKEFDLLVANEVGPDRGPDADTNRVTILGPGDRSDELPMKPKVELAEDILDAVEGLAVGSPAAPSEA